VEGVDPAATWWRQHHRLVEAGGHHLAEERKDAVTRGTGTIREGCEAQDHLPRGISGDKGGERLVCSPRPPPGAAKVVVP
jgi:hypothetical protein